MWAQFLGFSSIGRVDWWIYRAVRNGRAFVITLNLGKDLDLSRISEAFEILRVEDDEGASGIRNAFLK